MRRSKSAAGLRERRRCRASGGGELPEGAWPPDGVKLFDDEFAAAEAGFAVGRRDKEGGLRTMLLGKAGFEAAGVGSELGGGGGVGSARAARQMRRP